jgi:hypothetical protein
LGRFVKPESIIKYKDALYNLPYYRSHHQKDDDDLFVGNATTEFLNRKQPQIDKGKFFESVRNFYGKAVEYMVKKFPYKDPMLIHAQVANVNKQSEAKFVCQVFCKTV